jgi:hypothetical protein
VEVGGGWGLELGGVTFRLCDSNREATFLGQTCIPAVQQAAVWQIVYSHPLGLITQGGGLGRHETQIGGVDNLYIINVL